MHGELLSECVDMQTISSFLAAFQDCTRAFVCVCLQEVIFAAVNQYRHGTNTKVILFTPSHCSKYHEMREKHKAKLCRTKQRFEEETAWRNEKISSLERELSLCSHSLAKVNLRRCLAWLIGSVKLFSAACLVFLMAQRPDVKLGAFEAGNIYRPPGAHKNHSSDVFYLRVGAN